MNSNLDFVGELKVFDFGLGQKYVEEAKEEFKLLETKDIQSMFPKQRRTAHKYELGAVLALAGSKGMMGAAFLSTLACLRSGSGIVKILLSSENHY